MPRSVSPEGQFHKCLFIILLGGKKKFGRVCLPDGTRREKKDHTKDPLWNNDTTGVEDKMFKGPD